MIIRTTAKSVYYPMAGSEPRSFAEVGDFATFAVRFW